MRLPPAARCRILGALFLLTIGCIAFVTLTWLALRDRTPQPASPGRQCPAAWSKVHADDWAKKPLAAKPPADPDADDE